VLFPPVFSAIPEPRQLSKVTYPIAALAFTGILMFLTRLGARRQIGLLLRSQASQQKFLNLFGVSVPHGDTLNAVFASIDPQEFQNIVASLVDRLIRKKILASSRLLDRYYLVAIDGTGTLTFHQRHCAHCLTKTQGDTTTYYHPVLEAKLVTAQGFAFSLHSEFIENTMPGATKQDCELKAFYRLAAKLSARFPRLPLCLLLDGLFAGGPTFSLCRSFNWQFIIVLKDADLPSLNQEFDALVELEAENNLLVTSPPPQQRRQHFRWVNDISYRDSLHHLHSLQVVECREHRGAAASQGKKFKWVTSFQVQKSNVLELTNQGGRVRWKIENEGFNVQKNGGYRLEHAYSTDLKSAKIFYYLLQIACILTQLTEHGSLLTAQFPRGFGSSKNFALLVLEAWRTCSFDFEHFSAFLRQPFQIRFSFDSS